MGSPVLCLEPAHLAIKMGSCRFTNFTAPIATATAKCSFAPATGMERPAHTAVRRSFPKNSRCSLQATPVPPRRCHRAAAIHAHAGCVVPDVLTRTDSRETGTKAAMRQPACLNQCAGSSPAHFASGGLIGRRASHEKLRLTLQQKPSPSQWDGTVMTREH